MIRKIVIAINIIGIICVFMPYITVWLGVGDCRGSIAIIGGADSPAQLTLFADISSQGVLLTVISTCIFVINILVFWRKPNDFIDLLGLFCMLAGHVSRPLNSAFAARKKDIIHGSNRRD